MLGRVGGLDVLVFLVGRLGCASRRVERIFSKD